jgi:hypothetical protein
VHDARMQPLFSFLLLFVTTVSYAQGPFGSSPSASLLPSENENSATVEKFQINDGQPEPLDLTYVYSKIKYVDQMSPLELDQLVQVTQAVLGPKGKLLLVEPEENPRLLPTAFTDRVPVRYLYVPTAMSEEVNTFSQTVMNIAPPKGDAFVATIFGGTRFEISHWILISQNVDPHIALSLSLALGGVTFMQNAYQERMNNMWLWFGKGISRFLTTSVLNQPDELASQNWLKRYQARLRGNLNAPAKLTNALIFSMCFIYDMSMASALNQVGHLRTEAQTLRNAAAPAVPNNFLSTQKNRMFEKIRRKAKVYNFLPSLYFYAMQAWMSTVKLDAHGKEIGIHFFGGIVIPYPLVGSYLLYGVLIGINLSRPAREGIVNLTERAYDQIARACNAVNDQYGKISYSARLLLGLPAEKQCVNELHRVPTDTNADSFVGPIENF